MLKSLKKMVFRLGTKAVFRRAFPGSERYWQLRYWAGGDSGVGSYGRFATFKAAFLNGFVREHGVTTVIEFGCGDGHQLTLADYPDYAGYDVSANAIDRCAERFAADPDKRFSLVEQHDSETAELALSLDVIYHLTEDDAFESYMRTLFDAATRFVIIYSSDTDDNVGQAGSHVRHRKFTRWVQQRIDGWTLSEHVPNKYPYRGDYKEGSFADFFVYQKVERPPLSSN